MTEIDEIVEYLRRMAKEFRDKATRTLESGPAYVSVALSAAANHIANGAHREAPQIPGQLALFELEDL